MGAGKQVGPDNWEQMASGGGPSGASGGFGRQPFGGFADIFGNMEGAEIRFEGGAFDLGDLLRNAQRMVTPPPPPPDLTCTLFCSTATDSFYITFFASVFASKLAGNVCRTLKVSCTGFRTLHGIRVIM